MVIWVVKFPREKYKVRWTFGQKSTYKPPKNLGNHKKHIQGVPH
jgi:hypothetical protein